MSVMNFNVIIIIFNLDQVSNTHNRQIKISLICKHLRLFVNNKLREFDVVQTVHRN